MTQSAFRTLVQFEQAHLRTTYTKMIDTTDLVPNRDYTTHKFKGLNGKHSEILATQATMLLSITLYFYFKFFINVKDVVLMEINIRGKRKRV